MRQPNRPARKNSYFTKALARSIAIGRTAGEPLPPPKMKGGTIEDAVKQIQKKEATHATPIFVEIEEILTDGTLTVAVSRALEITFAAAESLLARGGAEWRIRDVYRWAEAVGAEPEAFIYAAALDAMLEELKDAKSTEKIEKTLENIGKYSRAAIALDRAAKDAINTENIS